MSVPTPPPPIPVTYLAGFLGAGKTTLLNRLLPTPPFAGTLVIVNEFGDIALDHALIEAAPGDTLLLPSGCLCCAVRGDLMGTLEDLLRRRDNGRIAPFARVVIEPTGLADPVGALQVLFSHPYLKLRYRLDGVITVVDAVNGLASLDTHAEAVRQVVLADRIVLAKRDLVTDGTAAKALADRLSLLAPGVPVIDTARAAEAATGLADIRRDLDAGDKRALDTWLGGDEAGAAPPHEGIRSFVIESDQPVAAPLFDRFLELLRSSRGPNLLRLKGVLQLAEAPEQPILVEAVQHIVHPPRRLPVWPDGRRSTRLVFIVRDLEPDFVARLWDAFRTDLPAPART